MRDRHDLMNLIMYRQLMRNTGLPQIWILTLSLQNLTLPNSAYKCTPREYAAHQGKRELVSMVSV